MPGSVTDTPGVRLTGDSRFSQASERRSPVQSHRQNSRERREDKVHYRECDQDANRSCGHVSLDLLPSREGAVPKPTPSPPGTNITQIFRNVCRAEALLFAEWFLVNPVPVFISPFVLRTMRVTPAPDRENSSSIVKADPPALQQPFPARAATAARLANCKICFKGLRRSPALGVSDFEGVLFTSVEKGLAHGAENPHSSLPSTSVNYLLTEGFSINAGLMAFYRKIHILGSFQNIKMARTAICNLILGKSVLLSNLLHDAWIVLAVWGTTLPLTLGCPHLAGNCLVALKKEVWRSSREPRAWFLAPNPSPWCRREVFCLLV